MTESQFSEGLKEAISLSRIIALERNYDYIGTEHMLLAILEYSSKNAFNKDKDLTALKMLNAMAVPIQSLLDQLDSLLMPKVKAINADDKNSLFLTKNLEQVLKSSFLEAKAAASSELQNGALFLSIIRDEEVKEVSNLLRKLGITYQSAAAIYKNIVLEEMAENDEDQLEFTFSDYDIATFTFTVPSKPISLFFDLEEFDAYEISEIIHELSALYESIGGDKLEIKGMQNLEFVRACLPA